MARQKRLVNVEFSGLRGRPTSTSNTSKSQPEYFEIHFTNGFRIGDIKRNIRVEQRNLQDVEFPEYKLTDLNNSGSDCYEITANWLSRILAENPSLNENVQAKVTSTREVSPYRQKLVVPFLLSSKFKPDILVFDKDAITDEPTNLPTDMDDLTNPPTDEDDWTNEDTACNHKCYIFFVEVVSNSNFIETVRKLYFDLTLQLIYVRSYNKTVTSVKGLVVPSMTERSKIGLGTITWDPDMFEFVADLRCVTKEDIESQLGGIIKQQWGSVRSGGEVRNDEIIFVDSLTPDDTRAYWSRVGIQLTQDDTIEYFPSLYSVVFSVGTAVYKFPLIDNDLHMCSALYSNSMNLNQVLIPKGVSMKAFRFDLLTRPLEISEVQLCFNSFVTSVFNAINQLHTVTGLAHMDIRRPNICFRDGQAILIDVDNLTDKPPEYTESIMYSCYFDNATKYDWRQYAIMLARILENNESQYHTQPPSFSHAQIGQELEHIYNTGIRPTLSKLKLPETEATQTLENVLSTIM